jgi:hypothetical protein
VLLGAGDLSGSGRMHLSLAVIAAMAATLGADVERLLAFGMAGVARRIPPDMLRHPHRLIPRASEVVLYCAEPGGRRAPGWLSV